MQLEPLPIPVVFRGGIDTLTDRKSVLPTQLNRLENGIFNGGVTIGKRTGFDALARAVDGTATVMPVGQALARRGAELVAFADGDLYSYRESSETWSRVGPAPSIEHTERSIAKTGSNQTVPDAATVDGIRVAAFEDSRGGVWWTVVESVGGRVLREPQMLALGGQSPRVVRNGDLVHVYYADATGGAIMVTVIDPTNYLATVVPIVLTNDLNTAAPYYDAVRYEGSAIVGNPTLIAWNHAATGGFRVGYVDGNGALSSTVPPGSWADQSESAITVAFASADSPYGVEVVGVARTDGGGDGVTATILSAGDLSLAEVATLSIMPLPAGVAVRLASAFAVSADMSTSSFTVWAEHAGATDRDAIITVGSITDGAVGPTATQRGHGLVSRGFVDNHLPSVIAVHAVALFPYAALLQITDVGTAPNFGGGVARLVVGLSDGLPARRHVATVEQDAIDPRVWRWTGVIRGMRAATRGVAQFLERGVQIVTLDFDSEDAYQTAEFGPNLIVAGAMPLRYDGDAIAEFGFHTAPDVSDGQAFVTVAAGAGLPPPGPPPVSGSMIAGTYLYALNYEEVDAAGEIHPGPMSAVPIQVTLVTGDNRLTITIPTYRLTSKRRVRIGVWRSARNDTTGDPAMYRVSSLDPSATGYNGYLLNDPTVDTVTFTDGMSEATLTTRERAYTNSGVLSNDTTGLGHLVIAAKERLFFNDPTDPEIVRYTQTRRDGYGAELPADLSKRVPYGAIRAFAVLDDALLCFTADVTSFFAGDGPLPNPDAAPQIGFTPPRIITGEVGCASPRSIASTPDRVLFQGSRGQKALGIHEINRAQQVSYVGAPAAAYNASRVLSADPVPGRTEVVFLLDHEDGIALCYNYYFGQWSVFTNHGGLDGVTVGGLYHYIRSNPVDGRVFRANTSSYLDAGVDVRLLIETAEIKVSGYHQGLQKIWYALFLGEWKSSHKLRIRFATNYRPGWGPVRDLDVDANHGPAPYGEGLYGAGPYGGSSNAIYQERVHCSLKCQTMRVQISDIANGAPLGASFELTEMLLTAGVMRSSQVFGPPRTH